MRLSKVLSEKTGGVRGKVFTIDSGSTIRQAAEKFCENKIGSLLVVQPDSNPPKYLGIITERDVIRLCCGNDNFPSATKVDDVMTKRMIVASQDDDVEYVMNVMTRHHIRHLPIIGKNSIIGVVSIGDIIEAIRNAEEVEIRHLSDYNLGTHANEVF